MERANKESETRLPSIEVFDSTDCFWDLFWQCIDKAEDACLVTTYDMDHKLVAAITLQKMTNACKRGVTSILIIDDLNYYASREGVDEFKAAGGIVVRNNLFSTFTQHVANGQWRRFFNRNH